MTPGFSRRLGAAVRNRDLSALADDAARVPGSAERGAVPDGPCALASEYLLEESRFKRRETSIDVYLSDVGVRAIDVECELPDIGWKKETWYLPLAFFPKGKVAPNLEVTDCDGVIIPIPTKTQNYATTSKALDELFAAGRLPRPENADLRKLVDEVVERPTFEAHICRLVYEEAVKDDLDDEPDELMRLLRLLEEHFVLWAPVEGRPRSEHLLRISRQEMRPPDRIVARRISGWRQVETAVGDRWALVGDEGESRPLGYGGYTTWPRGLLERLPKALGLRPIEASAEDLEAGRSVSTHLRVQAPPGFTVRNVRAGAMFPAPWIGIPRIEELRQKDSVVIQGLDQELNHVHLCEHQNPRQLYVVTTLTPRSGLITLWMLAAVITAIVLWTLHHQSRWGPLPSPDPSSGPQFVSMLGEKRRQLAINIEQRQIAAAVLLIAPAISAAWAILAEDGGKLLRSFLAGTRFLLLLSASTSIAAALALAGIVPKNLSGYGAMEAYAGVAYLVATLMVGSWLLASRPVWELFRTLLKAPIDNLLWIFSGGALVMLIGMMEELPPRPAGGLALVIGFLLALIGANSAAEPLRKKLRREGLYRTVAGFGAMPIIFFAGSLLGFYADRVPHEFARTALSVTGLLVLAGAVIGLRRAVKQAP